MGTRMKLKTALVGIGVVSALALSSGGSAYASSVRPDVAYNGCTAAMAFSSTFGYATGGAQAGNAACKYSFQYLDEPSGATGVIASGSLAAGQPVTRSIHFISGQYLRTCTNVNGLTNCTTWAS
jgi:hypothetical protein